MTKPKYCSWDLRDLAEDHGWCEESDERDITSVRLYKCCVNGTIYLNVHLQTGFTQVHQEKSDHDRILISSTTLIEFNDLEKALSETQFYNNENERPLDESMSKKSQLNGTFKSIPNQITKSWSNNGEGDNFDEINNLIRSWDEAEKV